MTIRFNPLPAPGDFVWQRFKQRFRLQFHRDVFESSRVKYFIRNLAIKSVM